MAMPRGFPRIWSHRTLFDTFASIAIWTWQRRGQAKSMGLAFHEETITESILLDLQTAEPNKIKVVPFSKREEARTGADWEWCFFDRDRNFSFPIRVQAKLLDDRGLTYSHIDRCIGNSGVRQIDQLLISGIPAIYVFYNHLNNSAKVPATCKTLAGCNEMWGCSFALADAVLPLARGKTFDQISRVSRPWSCLVCCGTVVCGHCGRMPHEDYDCDPFGVSRMLQSLRRVSEDALSEMNISDYSLREIPEPTKQSPSYFELAMAREITDRDRLRLGSENPGLAGTVLIGQIWDK